MGFASIVFELSRSYDFFVKVTFSIYFCFVVCTSGQKILNICFLDTVFCSFIRFKVKSKKNFVMLPFCHTKRYRIKKHEKILCKHRFFFSLPTTTNLHQHIGSWWGCCSTMHINHGAMRCISLQQNSEPGSSFHTTTTSSNSAE